MKKLYFLIVVLVVFNLIFLSLLILQTSTLKEKSFLLETQQARNNFTMRVVDNLKVEIGMYEEQTKFCVSGEINPQVSVET